MSMMIPVSYYGFDVRDLAILRASMKKHNVTLEDISRILETLYGKQ